MVVNEIGRIIGTVQASSFDIILNPNELRQHPPEIGEYVVINYEQGLPDKPVLGMITNLQIVNENYLQSLIKRPDALDRLKILGDLSEGEVLVANVKVLGYKEEGNIFTPRFPPIPGSKVFRAPDPLLNDIFNIGEAHIGQLRSHDNVAVSLLLNKLVSRHFSVLAITGAGKSYSIAVLIAEIIEKVKGSVIVIDPHDDYLPLAYNPKYEDRVVVFSTSPRDDMYRLCFKYSSLSGPEFCEILRVPSGASRQQALIMETVEELEGTDWDLDDFIVEINRNNDFTEAVRTGVLNRLRIFPEQTFLMRDQETPMYDLNAPSLVKSNQISIFSLGGLGLRIQQAAVSQLLRKLFNGAFAYKNDLDVEDFIPIPVLTIIEEAHNFCGPMNKSSLNNIARIAAEGRKFGLGLGIVSQRPGRVSSDILSQCNTQIILRVVNPVDQTQIRNSAELLSEDLLADLPGLNVGEAIVVGPSLPLPAFIKIRHFDGKLGGTDIDIVNEWKKAAAAQHGIKSQKYDVKKVDYSNVDY